ncbi:MAG: preprotein translocase subunit YajC [Lachnospiraceae bacterium]|nr:preprotein translocase subunit YajC [Lachnospiraceae bacterium]
MNLLNVLLETNAAAAGTAQGGVDGTMVMVFYVVILGLFFYFMIFRPQKKQEKAARELQDSIQAGDSITTTSGFYGVVLDIVDDTVIVEFGNNKNCRIPMMKSAIAAVEKADEGVEE